LAFDSAAPRPGADIIVIGAGMVGAALALGLLRRGMRVSVLDGGDADFRAAQGNAGLVWVQGKGIAMAPYRHLTERSAAAWGGFARELEELTGIDVELEQRGGLSFCLGEAALADRARLLTPPGASAPVGQVEMLDRHRLEALLPRLRVGPRVAGASLGHRDGAVHPLHVLRALHVGIPRLGGVLSGDDAVNAVVPLPGGGFRVGSRRGVREAGRVVIAAGLGTAALASSVGLDVEVRPERGQLLVTAPVAPVLDLPASGMRQLRNGTLQFGGTEESVGLDRSATATGAVDIARGAVEVAPAFARLELRRHWGCLRVLTADGAPVYAESARHPGAMVAVCHSGVTLAAAHAGEVAAAIAAGRLGASYAPFHPGRFDVSPAC
jgi:glycine/D-amino acid oxidase-like deaminating enzyme